MTAVADLDARIRQLWRPPPRLALSTWADEHFFLPAGDANAGHWSTLPYQRGIMDAISDPLIERVSLMKSARIGYTRGCICAGLGYFMHHDPSQVLLVQPTIDDAEKFSKEDIAPMLRDVPALRALVAEPKSRDSGNTILSKEFRGGSLLIIGANSPRGFRRTSRRVVFFDEIDGYPVGGAGTEGDQIELGIRRTEYYWNRKIVAGSTPTIAGLSRIETLFLEGDQRRRYVPCPHCGAFQVITLERMKWPEGQPDRAVLICDAKECVIEHRSKRDMDAAGEWRAEAPEHFTEFNRHASFHIWAGYSYSPNATWGQLAVEYVKAVRGGDLTHQTYKNTVQGLTWSVRGEAPNWDALMRRRETYRIGTVPQGALFLTAGVDVQKDRLVVEVVGWGRGKTSWSIDYVIIPGDTADLDKGPWTQLDVLVHRVFRHDSGADMPIVMLAVDSGFNTQIVYAWARRYSESKVIAIKGMQSGGALVSAPVAIDYTERGKKMRRSYKYWPVVGSIAKSELYGWLRLELPVDGSAPPPGYCHFPEYGEDYFRELTGEQLEVTKTRRGFPRMEWALIPGRQNHVLDARVYARAAAAVVGLDRLDVTPDFNERGQPIGWRRLELALPSRREAAPEERTETPQIVETTPQRQEQRRPAWLGPTRGGGWLKR